MDDSVLKELLEVSFAPLTSNVVSQEESTIIF